MPGPKPLPLLLTADLRASLMAIIRSRTESSARVRRAMIVVLAADGVCTADIARRTVQSARTVREWRSRFRDQPGLDALNDAPRSGRPSQVRVATRVAVVRIACERVDDGVKPKRFRDLWTHRSLAAEVKRQTGVSISASEVGRILRFNALRPHVVRLWLRSQDPDFDRKAARVCSLYLDPPDDSVVICVDEKPIQVLSRRYPTEVAKDASLRWEFEYRRNGTRALLAAFDVRTGKVIADLVPRRTGEALVALLQRVADAYPNKKVYVVWDNLNTHGDGPLKRWTRFNRRNGKRFVFVRTPIHASWLNQVECWFSILQRRVIRFGDFPNAEILEQRVLGFVEQWNEMEAHPFRWTWRSDRVENPRRRAA